MRLLPQTLSLRLLLWLGLLVMLAFGVGISAYYALSKEVLVEESRLRIADEFSQIRLHLEISLDRTQRVSQVLAQSLSIGHFDGAGLEIIAHDLMRALPEVQGATIAIEPRFSAQADGFATYVFRPEFVAGDVSNEPVLSQRSLVRVDGGYELQFWYQLARVNADAFWTNPYPNPRSGDALVVSYIVPIQRMTADGSAFAGVVMLDIDLRTLDAALQNISLGEHGYLMLISDSAHVLSHPRADMRMTYLPRWLKTQGEAWINNTVALLDGEMTARALPCWGRDAECLWAARRMNSTDWVIAGSIPVDDFFAPRRDFILKLLIGGGALMALVLLAVAGLTRVMMRPLANLVVATDALGHGDFNVPLPPADRPDEVGRLIGAFARLQARLRTFVDQLRQASELRGRLEGELRAAAQIQLAMLPQGGHADVSAPRYQLAGRLVSAKAVGGDLFFYRELPGNKLFFALGDVSDKGVPAALFMAKTITCLHGLAEPSCQPAKVMTQLNVLLCENNDSCMFVTLVVAVLDLTSGRLDYSNGGHTPPLLAYRNTVHELEGESGPALGLMDDVVFSACCVRLPPKSRLLCYTDGIDEAFGENEQMYGHVRVGAMLMQAVDTSPGDYLDALIADARQFTADASPGDDMTALCVDWAGPLALLIDAPAEADANSRLLPPELSAWGEISTLIEQQAQRHGWCGEQMHDVLLMAEEVFVNIVNHAGLRENQRVRLDALAGQWGVVMEFTDAGLAFNPLANVDEVVLGQNSDEAPIGGLGVCLVASMASEVCYRRDADENRFCFSRLASRDDTSIKED